MPLYEYECANGHRFEKIQKFSDPPIEVCPTCGGHVHKLISSPAFHLKGSGWYVTDYAKKDSGKSDAESGEKAASEKGEKNTSKDSKESKESKDTSAPDKDSSATKTESKPSSPATESNPKSPAKDSGT